jgi:hypothetical protein
MAEDERPDPERRVYQDGDWLPVEAGNYGNDHRGHRRVPVSAERMRGNAPKHFDFPCR